jgi:hypothetical protein
LSVTAAATNSISKKNSSHENTIECCSSIL